MNTHRVKYLKKMGYDPKDSYNIDELSKMSGVSKSILQQVYNRGIGAWKSSPQSVRSKINPTKRGVPKSQRMSKERWAMARIYSFLNNGKTAKTADKDLKEMSGAGKNIPILYMNNEVTTPQKGGYSGRGTTSDRPSGQTYFKALKNSYKAKAPNDITAYTLILDTPTLDAYIDEDNNSIIIGIRGTNITDMTDLQSNASLLGNKFNNSKRYTTDKKLLERLVQQFSPQIYNYYLAGHSLSGAIVSQLKRDFPFIKHSKTYNSAFQTGDLQNQQDDIERIYTPTDFLYNLGGRFFRNVKVVSADNPKGFMDAFTPSSIRGHRLSNFNKLYGGKKSSPVKAVLDAITRKKKQPNNYSNEIVDILNAMSFNIKELQVLGSMGFRSMLYASDYDCFEVVNASSINTIITQFKKLIRNLIKHKKITVGDIKIGQVDEWEVIDEFQQKRDYKYNEVMNKMKQLKKDGIITNKEFKKGIELVKPDLDELAFIKMKRQLRYHILRWKPTDILKGHIIHRGKKVKLSDAMTSKGLFKLDAIGELSSGQLQEFSIIYELRLNGKRANFKKVDFIESINEAIVYYMDKGSWFKVCKRMFSLYNYKLQFGGSKEAGDMLLEVFPLLDSDLGILYQVAGDLEVMLMIMEQDEHPHTIIKQEIDNMINRIANVYSSSAFLKAEPSILTNIQKAVKSKSHNVLVKKINKISDEIMTVLNAEALRYMKKVDLINKYFDMEKT